jgi:hypothetical protein
MLWLTVVALIAAFFIWIFSPDVISALWVTVATVTGGWLVVELLSGRRTRDRRARSDSWAIPKSGDRRQRYGRREDDNV